MGLSNAKDVQEQCEKAARTLQAFVDKGKIPPQIIAKAKGLAVFSAFRAGMYFAGTAGTGVVVARLMDGSWSSPSAFAVRAGSIGIVYGVDVYDCVCVLNTQEAMEAFTKSEMQLGTGLTLAAGPVGVTADIGEVKPVWTYTKSKGLYGGVTIDATVIKELPAANAAFYGAQVSTVQILKGEVQAKSEAGVKQLVEVLRTIDCKREA